MSSLALTMPKPASLLRRVENGTAGAALLGVAALPLLDLVLRELFQTSLPGSASYLRNLTLWVGLLGAAVALRDGRHLMLARTVGLLPSALQAPAERMARLITAAVLAGLAWAATLFVISEFPTAPMVGLVPLWAFQAIMPAAFLLMILDAGGEDAPATLGGLALAALIGGAFPQAFSGPFLAVALAVLLVSGSFGAPIFVVLAGATLLLFLDAEIPAAALAVEGYRIISMPSLPALVLFTFGGVVLASGGASARLVRLSRALFGWLPGGLALATVLICALFTSVTGATGVTILALGGLLFQILRENGYEERYALGLITATGALGLLFPPSLPVILVGVVAHVSILDLFLAGLLPGLLMVASVAGYALYKGARMETARPRFAAGEAAAALWHAKWELVLPALLVWGLFGGHMTLLETAAAVAAYALAVELLVHRELSLFGDVPQVLLRSATLIGAIFMVLITAMGLTNYMVDAEVPMWLASWAGEHVPSRGMFLLIVNLLLLVVGCFLDIYSAILLVLPLLLPLAERFEVDPLHLGIIFLVNLELGYLTPPIGLNLFLAASRFDRPVMAVARAALPFGLVLIAVLLIVTYVPALTLALVR
jgi:C4-dicarboxylate transporter, DctM subunit